MGYAHRCNMRYKDGVLCKCESISHVQVGHDSIPMCKQHKDKHLTKKRHDEREYKRRHYMMLDD